MIKEDNLYLNSLTHLDTYEKILNQDHYGYYVVTTKEEETSSRRLYFSQEQKIEYYESILKPGKRLSKNVLQEASYILINKYSSPEDIVFILYLITSVFFLGQFSRADSRSILRGIKLTLETLKYLEIDREHIYSLSYETQVRILKENPEESIGRLILKAYLELSKTFDTFVKYNNLGKYLVVSKDKSIESIDVSPSVLYQLRMFAIKELNSRIKKYEEYQQWLQDYSKIFSQKNILKTLLDFSAAKKGIVLDIFFKLLDKKHRQYYKDYRYKLNNRRKNQACYKDYDKFMEYINNYLKNSEVLKMDIRTFSLIMYATGCEIDCNCFKKEFHYGKTNTCALLRQKLYREFEINRADYIEYTVLDMLAIYPLYLLALIETGCNSEVLKSWLIRLEGKNYTLGVERGLVMEIAGYKNRSNSGEYDVLISKENKLWKYIEVFLRLNTQIYKKRYSDKFFQYYSTARSIDDSLKVQVVDRSFLSSIKASSNNFFEKYKIIDSLGKRIKWIDHTLLRKAHNYQLHLQGKTLYERQISKNHKDANTTENSYSTEDYNLDKKIKLGDILENIFDKIFVGKIQRKESGDLIEGLLGNCLDNTKPTYIGQKLKKNHNCLDWKKCLTQCDKCIVIPRIHGPAIIAWRNYLLDLRDTVFINHEHFYKEGYGYDLQAAQEALVDFSEEEYIYSIEHCHKYEEIIKLEIPTSIKSEVVS